MHLLRVRQRMMRDVNEGDERKGKGVADINTERRRKNGNIMIQIRPAVILHLKMNVGRKGTARGIVIRNADTRKLTVIIEIEES